MALDPTISAVVAIADDALRQAEALDRAVAKGRSIGPFHGVPFTAKDIIETADLPTTLGRRTCTLRLDVDPVNAYGETVVLHVSGMTGIGGIDNFTSWRNRTEEAHLFLVDGITEFDYLYRYWSIPGEEPPPPLEPGHYRVHATDITGCEVHARFRVTA